MPKYTEDELTITEGDRVTKLNADLVQSQNITPKGLHEIKMLHGRRMVRVQLMEDGLPTDKERLKKLAEQIQRIDFLLQDCWGFPRNKTFHRWFELPHCRCPKMDNRERLGTKYGIIAGDCPIHGFEEPKNA